MALPFRTLGLGVTGALLCVALGVTLGAYVVAPPVPDSLTAPPDVTTAMATSRPFDDSRTVRVKIQLKEATPVNTPVAGRVTALSIAPNTSLASGTKVMEVDGLPVVALSTTTPLYRELADGVAGDDVMALQEELQRLGYDIGAGGAVNWETRWAAADLLGVDDGHGGVPQALPHTHFLWLPAQSVTVNEVKVNLGDTLTDQSILLTLTGGANSGVVDIPADVFPGDRVLVFQDKEYPVGANGVVDNQELLSAMLATDQATRNSGGGTDGQAAPSNEVSLSIPFRLATPVDVQLVPAAALFGVRGSEGCVASNGQSVRVTIVASELGQTFVQAPSPLGEVSLVTEGMTCQ